MGDEHFMQYQIARGTDVVVSILRLVLADPLQRLVDDTRAAQLLRQCHRCTVPLAQIEEDIREMREKHVLGPVVLDDCVISMGRRYKLSD